MQVFNHRELGIENKKSEKGLQILLENFLSEIENQLATIDVKKTVKKLKSNVKAKDPTARESMYSKYMDSIIKSENINDGDEKALQNLSEILGFDKRYTDEKIYLAKCKYLSDRMDFFIQDKKLLPEDLQKIESLEKGLRLSHDDVTNCYGNVARKYVIEYFNEMVAAKRISPDEDAGFKKLCSDLHIDFSLSEEQNSVLEELRLLWKIENNKIEPIESDINLHSTEKLFYKTECRWLESRKKTVGYSYMGVSKRISIAKGMSFRVGGGSGGRITEDCLQEIDRGMIYVTDKRIIFVGGKGAKNIPINKILSFEITDDGLKISKETGKSPVLSLANGTLSFAGILSYVIGWSKDFLEEYASTEHDMTLINQVDFFGNKTIKTNGISRKNKSSAALLAFFFGWLGVHSFYAGRSGRGVAQLLLSFTGASFVWGFIDFILICCDEFKDSEGNIIK